MRVCAKKCVQKKASAFFYLSLYIYIFIFVFLFFFLYIYICGKFPQFTENFSKIFRKFSVNAGSD